MKALILYFQELGQWGLQMSMVSTKNNFDSTDKNSSSWGCPFPYPNGFRSILQSPVDLI
jgi:hypothetical protein